VGFPEWLARKGTVGETARTVGQQYLVLKRENPQEELPKILGVIIMARGKAVRYSFDQFSALVAAAADGRQVVRQHPSAPASSSTIDPPAPWFAKGQSVRDLIDCLCRGCHEG